MGFLSRRIVSKAPVEQWSADDVQAWAKRVAGLPKPCRKALKQYTGKQIVKLTPEDIDAEFDGVFKAFDKAVFQNSLQALTGEMHIAGPHGTLSDDNLGKMPTHGVLDSIINIPRASHTPTLASVMLKENVRLRSSSPQAEQGRLPVAMPVHMDQPPKALPADPTGLYEIAVTHPGQPEVSHASDGTDRNSDVGVHEVVNPPASFEPVCPQQCLRKSTAQFQINSGQPAKADRQGHILGSTSQVHPIPIQGVLKPLQAMSLGSQSSSKQNLSDTESTSMKPYSTYTCGTVSVQNSKQDSVERQQLRRELGVVVEQKLMDHFLVFANFSNRGELLTEMDGVLFAKYCTDTGITKGDTTCADADLAFAGVKTKGARRITFDQFVKALKMLSVQHETQLVDVVEKCLVVDGPINHSAAKVNSVRLHDDKSTYTGVYKRGGPDTMEGGFRSLHQITNRKPADSRGVLLPRGDTCSHLSNPILSQRRLINGFTRLKSTSSDLSSSLAPSTMADYLEEVFVSFASFGKGVHQASIALDKVRMDSKAFAKIMKDAGVMCGKLNLARVDLCFTKCYDKVSKRMSFEQFLLGLKECAAARGDNPHKFKETIARCQPVVHGTVAGHVKWHDDQSMYTGVYAHGGPTNVDWKPSFKDVVNRDVCQTRANKRGLISWTA